MIAAVLAAEAVGVAAPINPALAAEHAAELVRLSAARVIVAAGPELDARVWSLARRLAAETGARALLALRPTAPEGPAPELEPLAGVTVAHLAALARDAADDALTGEAPRDGDLASYLHTGGTTGAPKLAARTHRYRIAAMSAVPTVYATLATLPVDADISSLRMPIVGAAPLPRAVVDAFLDRTGSATATEVELRAWATARVPEPAAAPKRVEVIDAIPLTAVGKPFKPELRRRAAEAVAREALADRATGVTARLADGQAIVVSVRGADDGTIQEALGAFSFAWENATPRPGPRPASAEGNVVLDGGTD